MHRIQMVFNWFDYDLRVARRNKSWKLSPWLLKRRAITFKSPDELMEKSRTRLLWDQNQLRISVEVYYSPLNACDALSRWVVDALAIVLVMVTAFEWQANGDALNPPALKVPHICFVSYWLPWWRGRKKLRTSFSLRSVTTNFHSLNSHMSRSINRLCPLCPLCSWCWRCFRHYLEWVNKNANFIWTKQMRRIGSAAIK